ncbi:MAG: universal stress protein [Polaromonas sp.]|uniref:universal stress protein n=1 Tax=Polaromonas sp. TaxID=1869339 RepID=UPI0027311F2F|nr:universal stress protein [Polaromonas sp.]MDP2451127.1 universal stress protein [Polaromonas sp.]MDP3249181.1 universal stress protein [Polaromonas sp.]
MTTIHSIVAATDFSPGSDAAVERAVQIALAHGAPLRLLHAFEVSAWHSLKGVFDAKRLTMDPPADVRMQQRLTALAVALAERTGLQVEARFNIGDPDSAIKAYVAAHATSLVVIASRADTAVPGVGSTTSKVVRSPACPVLVVRLTPSHPYGKVLTAVDLREVSMRAAFTAVALFPASQHHLLMAMDPALDHALRLGDVTKEQARVLRESMHTETVQQMDRLARELSEAAQHPVAAEVVNALPARALIEQAQVLTADCVAVGHHGQGALEALFLGSTAQHVLHHTLRDVLVVP